MELIERFEGYPGRGRPCLRAWKNPKTMTVEWNDGSLWAYREFRHALDTGAMNAELFAVWKRHRPTCRRHASFSHGDVGGCLTYVPHAAGMAAVDIVGKHYSNALAAVGALMLDRSPHQKPRENRAAF
jgi:hypothetical protein